MTDPMVDALLSQARRTAESLNLILDQLAEHGIHTMGVEPYHEPGYLRENARVQLVLRFPAPASYVNRASGGIASVWDARKGLGPLP